MSCSFTSTHLPTATQLAAVRELSRLGSSEPTALQAIVAAIVLDLERYDTEIQNLPIQREINRLISERITLLSYLGFCRSALSPVHKLPNELLVSIFAWCFPSQLYSILGKRTPEEEVDCVSHRYLRDLSRVCYRWYHIAMETPQLWSTIVVDARLWNRSHISVAALLLLLEASLRRGREHPLHLEVYAVAQHHHTIFELLSQYARRWKTAIIWGKDVDDGLRACAGNLGQLEKLSLAGKWKDVETFQTAPRLRELTYRGAVDKLPKMPWKQIQRCAYIDHFAGDVSLSSRLSFFRVLPNLADAKFALDLKDSSIDEPLDITITSDVRHIQFDLATTTTSSATACRFFDSLTFPSLKSFSLYPPRFRNPPVWSSPHFLRLAARSAFEKHLVRLVIHAVITDTELLRCLEVLPKLKFLSVTDCTSSSEASQPVITDTFLQKLTYVSGTGTPSMIVPHLESLTLKTVLDFADASYVDLIDSRAGKDDRDTFTANLWWVERRRREVSVDALDKIVQLTREGGLLFKAGERN
ncbi:hypothetical protein R3P38DRAFT_2599839 [Favolaschia claudopus]|uniref:F-box domain-containing protein n=1 Tax=Favolaschia claudopus TaxID=2862362 RepID=A0AAW0E5T2_9AGAR